MKTLAAIGRRLVSALLAFGFALSVAGGAAGAGSSLASIPNLTGDWKLDSGGVIHITFSNALGRPVLLDSFTSGGDCPYGGTRPSLFDTVSFKDANTMTGLMNVCTGTKVLIDKCGLSSLFTVTYKTTSISKTTIMGTRTSEWYDAVDGSECKFTRNASKDTQKPFVLTRTSGNPCPDTATIKAFNKDASRAVTVISVVLRHVQSGSSVAQGLSSTQSALNTISSLLGQYVAAGQKCDQIHSVIDDITTFQSAIDQINNAGCDSNALAGGFDNLFRTAGEIGNQFSPLPALSPAFTILSQDQNFFTTVSGNLNPEQRWADQFQSVEGYIPTCSQ